jgi:tRNA (guanine-N7-)-methyltransferase
MTLSHRAMPAPPTLVHPLASILEPLDLDALFSRRQPVEVDLGSGDGTFLVRHAAAVPERNFLGVERLLGRLRKTDRKGLRLGLSNLRLIRLDVVYFVRHLLPAASVAALHIYFPDPWPKRRHAKNRLVNADFPAQAARVLVPGGCVYLRTDSAEYFAQMREVFAAHPGFGPVDTPADLLARPTDFERDFRAAGRAVFHAAYRLTSPTLEAPAGHPPA